MRNIGKIIIKVIIPFALTFAIAFTLGCIWTGRDRSDKFSHAFDPFLAHDAKTGEYMGVVISECRDWESKRPLNYKVRLKDGSEIEKSPDSITINSP